MHSNLAHYTYPIVTPNASRAFPIERPNISVLLQQYDNLINSLGEYPAKDIINQLTIIAENLTAAKEISTFVLNKIRMVPPPRRLPIFYLIDSIMKNVGGPYIPYFGQEIIALFTICVSSASTTEIKRYEHVLNTWEKTQLFSVNTIRKLRGAVEAAENALVQPAFTPYLHTGVTPFSAGVPTTNNVIDTVTSMKTEKLRHILRDLQNKMNIHPTEHYSLEEVETKNPDLYKVLIAYYNKQVEEESETPVLNAKGAGILGSAPSVPTNTYGHQSLMTPNVAPNIALLGSYPSSMPIPRNEPLMAAPRTQLPPLIEPSRPTTTINREAIPQPDLVNKPTSTVTDPDKLRRVLELMEKIKARKSEGDSSAQTGNNRSPTQGAGAVTEKVVDSPVTKSFSCSPQVVLLKDRIEEYIMMHYQDMPFQCPKTGLRFKEKEAYEKHLEFVTYLDKAAREQLNKSRAWYPTRSDWITDFQAGKSGSTSSSYFDVQTKDTPIEDDSMKFSVPQNDDITICRICGEKFDVYWNEEEEEWMYGNAVHGVYYEGKDCMEASKNNRAMHNMLNNKNNSLDAIQSTAPLSTLSEHRTIFHKRCYDAVLKTSKYVTTDNLIPDLKEPTVKATIASFDDNTDDEDEDNVNILTSAPPLGKRSVDGTNDKDMMKRQKM